MMAVNQAGPGEYSNTVFVTTLPVGVHDVGREIKAVFVYPNPANTGEIIFLLEVNPPLDIFDVLGRHVATTALQSFQAPAQSGVYIVRESGGRTGKLIVR